MALIVETGQGASNSESYISVADADAYFSARGITLWGTLLTEEKEQALRRATDYMEGWYSTDWKGQRISLTQALSWPRTAVKVDGWILPSNEIPAQVVKACAEMAFRAAGGDLAPDQSAQVKSETVGPISVTYADGARQKPKYSAIDAILSSLLAGGGGSMVRLVRG